MLLEQVKKKLLQLIILLQTYWHIIYLILILAFIIIVNFKPNAFILGNDNYSPELNPLLTVERSFSSPAWRSYRGLGVPSDSEQADVFRAIGMYFAQFILPRWLVSQLFIFIAFLVAGIGSGLLCRDIVENVLPDKKFKNIAFFSGGLLYCLNLIAAWIYFSPLEVFLVGYAFFPIVLWSLGRVFRSKDSAGSLIVLFLSITLITTSSMVATTYLVELFIFIWFVLFFSSIFFYTNGVKKTLKKTIETVGLFIGTQLFWILPFLFYVKSNALALQKSFINRILTPSIIEQEIKYNTLLNTPRYLFSWLYSLLQNSGLPQIPYSSWYLNSFLGQILSYVPILLALTGVIVAFRNRRYRKLLIIFPLLLISWFVIKGINAPFEQFYVFLQNKVPLFRQVFRWQSSKLFPGLLLPITIFASFGITYVLYILDTKSRIETRFRTIFTSGVFLVFIMCTVGYMFPFFIGDFTGTKAQMVLPEDYMQLKEYLAKNYPTQRIYIAPEANTLYFRSLSWGFFGSSFLNYLIPNPLIEKAFTTGSLENETAQNVLENSLYSQDSSVFARALIYYKTPLVLMDKYASPSDNGYTYDWAVIENGIEKSPYLQRVWQKGELSLYKVNKTSLQDNYISLYAGHENKNLQQMLVSQNSAINYYSKKGSAGVIFPLFLKFDSMQATNKYINGISTYFGNNNMYTYTISDNIYNESPIFIKYNSGSNILEIKSGVPLVTVNDATYPSFMPFYDLKLHDGTEFISFGSLVFDLKDISDGVFVDIPFGTSQAEISEWSGSGANGQLSSLNNNQFGTTVPQDSIVSWHAFLHSTRSQSVQFCIYSTIKQSCINGQSPTAQLEQGDNTFDLMIPQVVSEHDALTLYISPQYKNSLNVNVDLKIYSHNEKVNIPKNALLKTNNENAYRFYIHKGDKLTVQIPKIYGMNSFQYVPDSKLIPQTQLKKGCIIQKTSDGKSVGNNLLFTAENCEEQVVVNFQPLFPKKLALLYYEGGNSQGIPLRISVRDNKSQRKIFEDQFTLEGATNNLSMFLFPSAAKNYVLELFNYSISWHKSVSTVQNVSFEFLPQSWNTLELVPDNLQSISTKGSGDSSLFSINQARHPNGTLLNSGNGSPVTVNNWEQGWIVDTSSNSHPVYIFWPNLLSWVGYLIYLAIIVGLFLLAITEKRKERV